MMHTCYFIFDSLPRCVVLLHARMTIMIRSAMNIVEPVSLIVIHSEGQLSGLYKTC